MRQISFTAFDVIVKKLKTSNDFTDFLKKVQDRINNFGTNLDFKYSEKKSGNKKETKKYKVGDSPAKDFKFKKILAELSNISNYMFMTPSKFEVSIIPMNSLALNEKDPIDYAFGNKILTLLGYEELRSGEKKLLYQFYKELGVKSCVYCNAQHTVLLNDNKKTMRLQADHFIPKSKFPMFSITLANLIPVCNNCNHLKSDKDLKYSLYYDDINGKHHDLGFSLTGESIADYCTNRNSEIPEDNLKIKFKDYYGENTAESSRLNEILKIDMIYENHNYIAADLINKKIMYKDSYLTSLGEDFSKLFKRENGTINKQLFNQMLYGHSLDEEDINKKVFSKLTIDIKRQLDRLDIQNYLIDKEV